MKQKAYTVYLPDDLVKAIEEYKNDNYITTRNAAIVQLIAKSLNEGKEGSNGEQGKR